MTELWREGIFLFQEKCIEFLVSKTTDNGNAVIFDEMGLGKTIESIRGADAIQAQKIFIVCPAIARLNWAREVEK